MDRIGGTQQKISRLLKHIRHLSEASGTRESAKAVFLHNLTSDCLELCHSRLLQYQIQVKMEVSPSLIVSARAYEIMQIFINLIENSIQANKITPSPWIQIQATKEADFAMVTFTDSGLGLHRTALENFDKATAPGQKLTLHGLPIADYLAKANGGSLQIIKNPENSQLILRLPLYKNFQKS